MLFLISNIHRQMELLLICFCILDYFPSYLFLDIPIQIHENIIKRVIQICHDIEKINLNKNVF
jgi:hypothetical protein